MLEILLSNETRHRSSVPRSIRSLALPFAWVVAVLGCSEGGPAPTGTVKDPSHQSDDSSSDDDSTPSSAGKDAGKPAGQASGKPVDAGRTAGSNGGGAASGQNTDASARGPATGVDGGVDIVPTSDGGATTQAQQPLPKCKGGAMEPCGTFVSRDGKEIPLGRYGAVMEANVGQGFENTVNASDNATSCALFSSLFGQDPEASAELNDLMGLDLKLYTVYRPASWVAGEKYPLVSWGNGTCAQPEGYSALLRYVASQGFIVIAPNSRYVGSGNEQKRAIDFMLKANADSASPYFERVDPSKVAAMGHSQGGMGTVAASSDARIKAVILFNGGTSASKPFFGFSGERDIGSPTASTYQTAVNKAAKAAFIFFHKIPGTGSSDGHLTLMLQPERVIEPTAQWLKLMLNDDAESKAWFVGDSCKLCGHAADYDFGQKGL